MAGPGLKVEETIAATVGHCSSRKTGSGSTRHQGTDLKHDEKIENCPFREYTLSTLFLRAKTKQAKFAKNHAKSERGRYIYKEFMALDLEKDGKLMYIDHSRAVVWEEQ